MVRKIKQERMQRGWTLRYVETKTNVTEACLSLIENGKRNPSYSTLLKLEDLFQMPHRELFAEYTQCSTPQTSMD